MDGTDDELDFEAEDIVEVGSDVDAYCTKCKMDTTHVVVAKYEEEIRRVQCNICGSVHNYRPPKGDAEEDPVEPAKKKAPVKKVSWEEVAAKRDFSSARAYSFDMMLKENDLIHHGAFGHGVVTELLGPTKAEIVFEDQKRIMVYNRPDLAKKKA